MALDSLRQDIRYAVRGLRMKPAFAGAVVLTLALGIGANTAMFGIVDQLLFRPPPMLKNADRVHRVYTYETYRGKESAGSVSRYARYVDLTKWTTSFDRTAGYSARDLAVGVGDAAREMRIGVVSASFFEFFDAPPVLGRYFTAAEDQTPAGQPVVVLSYPMWQSEYGGKHDILGTKVQIGPIQYTVIGVSPESFVGLWTDRHPAAFIPITSYAASTGNAGRNTTWWQTYSWGWMSMIAQRKATVSIAQANADLSHAEQLSYDALRLEQTGAPPAALAKPRAIAGSLFAERGPTASSTGKVATWLGGVSIIVLLIACANVANLLLARALKRRREIALRVALGVSGVRLTSQLLIESVMLALLGGIAGLIIAHAGGSVLRASLFNNSEASGGLRDARSVLFAAAAAVFVGLLTGLTPVLQARRTDLANDLKAGMREGTYARSRTRIVLLVVQAALSVVLLVGAGLFVRSLRNVESIRLGFDVEPVLLIEPQMRGLKLDSVTMVGLRHRLLDKAKATPGVTNATFQTGVPFWSTSSTSLFVQGIDTVGRLGQFNYNRVSPEFFQTIGTRIIRGRGFGPSDVENSPRVTVVSEGMGKVLWPGSDAIGQCLRVSADTMPCTTVVGIAEDIKSQSLGPDSSYYYYVPAVQSRPQGGGLFVRVNGNAAQMKESVRKSLQPLMPGSSYINVTPLSQIVGSQTQSWHLGATMFVVFGVLALILAAIGLYSVIAYNVAQRTHELGVRRALGAQASDIMRLVVADGLRVALLGVAIGVVVAIWAGKWAKPLLFDVSPHDPLVFAIVTVTLTAVACAASWLPARRASKVEANVALRSE
ncbi:MAG TPA: ABC transporter permease [Gemmatimonadaceae bacterium]|jgi:predicted permease